MMDLIRGNSIKFVSIRVKQKWESFLTNNSHFTKGYRSNLQCQATVIMTGCLVAEAIHTALNPWVLPVTVLSSGCPFDYPKVILAGAVSFLTESSKERWAALATLRKFGEPLFRSAAPF